MFPGQKMLFECSAIAQGGQCQLLVKCTDQHNAEATELPQSCVSCDGLSGLLVVVRKPVHNLQSWNSRGKKKRSCSFGVLCRSFSLFSD